MRPSVELIEIIHANQVMYGEPCHLSGNGIFANHVIYAEAPSMAHSIWDAARAHGCHSCERTSSMRARSSMRNMNVLVPNPRSGRSSGAPRRMRATLCKSASAPGHGDETSSMRKRHLCLGASRMPASARRLPMWAHVIYASDVIYAEGCGNTDATLSLHPTL